MNLLLDTHAFLWWLADDARLPRNARSAISDRGNTVLVSAVSAMEITTKHRIGKLPEAGALADDIGDVVSLCGFEALSISVRHGETAGRLAILHKDPFDRLLIAQALVDGLTLVTNERLFDDAGVRRLW